MSTQPQLQVSITLDPRRNRIRIHRQTLHSLGDPAYVQFLVNPEELYIAVLGSDKPVVGGTANKVRLSTDSFSTSQSVEFYSATMMNRLLDVVGGFDLRFSYLLTGEIDQINRVAYFSLKTAKQAVSRRPHGRERI